MTHIILFSIFLMEEYYGQRSKPYLVDLWPILIVNTRRRIGSGTFITLYLGEYLLLPISVFPVISFTSDSENNVTDFDINEDTPDDKPPRSTAIAINRCFIIEFPFSNSTVYVLK